MNNESVSNLKPLEYDEDRLDQFCKHITGYGNFPREYRPDSETVDYAAFADAMLGHYGEMVDLNCKGSEAARSMMLARKALAIDYLQGVDIDELDGRKDDGKRSGIGSAKYFSLKVASEARRYAKKYILIEEMPVPGDGDSQHELSIDKYADLDGLVRDMYHTGRVTSGEAQALLLLFEQQASDAPADLQRRIVDSISYDIYRRLLKEVPRGKHRGNELVDEVLAKGVRYVRTVIRSPMRRLHGDTPMNFVTKMEANTQGVRRDMDTAKASAQGHIGYVLDKLYP